MCIRLTGKERQRHVDRLLLRHHKKTLRHSLQGWWNVSKRQRHKQPVLLIHTLDNQHVRGENSSEGTRTRGFQQDGMSQSESNSEHGSDGTSTYHKISYEPSNANMAAMGAHQRARHDSYGAVDRGTRDSLSAEVRPRLFVFFKCAIVVTPHFRRHMYMHVQNSQFQCVLAGFQTLISCHAVKTHDCATEGYSLLFHARMACAHAEVHTSRQRCMHTAPRHACVHA
jgi:hypothetical protein